MSDDIVEKIVMKGKAAEEIRRLREENEKLLEELEEMREACQANYMLGIERGKEDARSTSTAVAALRESEVD